jgi:RNA polymerase-binding transcription factor DksA
MLESLQESEDAAETRSLRPSGGERYQQDDEPVEEIALATELGALDAEEELGYAVREALQRVRDGTYGTCAACGEWISRERLRLVPFARLCRGCAARGA